MHKLYKKCGKEMTVNDTSLQYALSLGWTKTKPKQTKKPTKKAD